MLTVTALATLALARTSLAVPAAVQPLAAGVAAGPGHMSSDQCARCHTVDAGFSHPTDKVPPAGMQLPAELPLENGRVTCITCHEDSADSHAKNRLGVLQANPSLLRVDAVSLCGSCHDSLNMDRASMHPIAATKAHLSWSKPIVGKGKLASRPKQKTLTFESTLTSDDGSSSCISCHDGTTASDSISSGQKGPLINTDTGHPFGIVYGASPKGSDLKPASRLDPRLRLFSGRVTCQTCHSLYSSERKLLSMPNRDSAMCINCHDL